MGTGWAQQWQNQRVCVSGTAVMPYLLHMLRAMKLTVLRPNHHAGVGSGALLNPAEAPRN